MQESAILSAFSCFFYNYGVCYVFVITTCRNTTTNVWSEIRGQKLEVRIFGS